MEGMEKIITEYETYFKGIPEPKFNIKAIDVEDGLEIPFSKHYNSFYVWLEKKIKEASNQLDGVIIKVDPQAVPNGGSEVITIDLIMLNAVKQCQKVLAEWIVPDSKTNDADCLNKLLEIVDNKSLVQYMNTIESNLIKS